MVRRFITVGVSEAIDEEELRQIATTPSDFFFANDFEQLASLLDGLIEQVR